MWQSTGETRFGKIWIEDDCLKADDAYDSIFPFDKPDLPNEFAKVNDPKSALRFERKYAPLDYDYLVVDTKERQGGDPVEWVLEHARFVRLAIDLTYALAIEDGRGALRLFGNFVVYKDYSHHALRGTGELTYPRGAIIDTTIVPAPKSESDALWYAPSVITLLVNANTMNIHQELILDSKGRIMPVQRYHALIEAIWSMVGDLATKTRQEDESAYFKRCKRCGTPFLATDKRQKFCPPILSKESLCGNKFRQHKFQAKKSK